MQEQTVSAIREIVEQKDIFSLCAHKYYTSVARGIEAAIPCRIHLRPSSEKEFKGQAQTWSRVTNVEVGWPEEITFHQPDHWIIYDRDMPPAAVARCIAHELYHVLGHDPTSPRREVDKDRRVGYTDEEERNADIFSLLLLKNRQYMRSREAPLTSEQLLKLLRGEAGKPFHLSWGEIEGVLDDLDWPEAENS